MIEVSGLVKHFGKFVAVDGLDLRVPAGAITGFLGPNGSGKSTVIRVLLGLLRYDAGTVRVFGGEPRRDAVQIHRRLAYVPGDVALWPQLTGGECIDLLLSVRGVADSASTRRDELIERFALDPTKKTDAYSKGNRQKVAIIAALAAPCDLLLLDEPTSGLDPVMTRMFIEEVRARAEDGAAVLMSSHLLAEVEQLCTTVTLIAEGRTVQAGTLDQLRHLRRSRVVATVPAAARQRLAATDWVHDLQTAPVRQARIEARFTVDADHLGRVAGLLADLAPRTLSIEPPSLEELFLHTYSAAAR
ncbi:putative ABC transporter ATP-binding protein [Gordonia hirsuta DSM 44140 = NBRC 16056]|uniref:Putative ABC transporter ATP-binding protein n=1 Tax=Gordonia hirsuta DSM 44140 = NBRC 16056 TaxID=1121927 RepID=L7LBU4_9ACTN|nr:putative ABC transporter ATP-binding protein [Gordonia hirsuta DSM 44140 = NBRC 16056]